MHSAILAHTIKAPSLLSRVSLIEPSSVVPAMDAAGECCKRRRTPEDSAAVSLVPCSPLDLIPDGVLVYNILSALEPVDLCSMLLVSRKMRDLQDSKEVDTLVWGKIAKDLWNSDLLLEAVALAGSFRAFALSKQQSVQLGFSGESGFLVPSEHELQASLQRVVAAVSAPSGISRRSSSSSSSSELTDGSHSESGEVPHAHVLFLLDGSGSVGDEEFAASTSFIARAATNAKIRSQCPCKVSVMQFSNDVRTEWEDASSTCMDDVDAFGATIRSMVRMNGGTNIAAALTHASKVLKKNAAAEVAKVIVLITDGRVDRFQAKEARQVAAMLADEQPNTTMFAYGVGRGVDRTELLGIIGAAAPAEGCRFRAPEARYLDLFHKDEVPW